MFSGVYSFILVARRFFSETKKRRTLFYSILHKTQGSADARDARDRERILNNPCALLVRKLDFTHDRRRTLGPSNLIHD
jgi:hypothetical protein